MAEEDPRVAEVVKLRTLEPNSLLARYFSQGEIMDRELIDRAEAIQKRILQLRDSL